MKKTDLRETVTRNHRGDHDHCSLGVTTLLQTPRRSCSAYEGGHRATSLAPHLKMVSRAFCMPELGSPLPRSLWRQDLLFFLFVCGLLSHPS